MVRVFGKCALGGSLLQLCCLALGGVWSILGQVDLAAYAEPDFRPYEIFAKDDIW